ncbi:MAG: hypothetical protein F9K23_12395 [Bacteroidetes bacterium]|nr:MAG: hypothetical protein F9K23_12395 [Bacteroidota bacterium]
MTKAEELYHRIAETINNATKSKMFGAMCLKAPNGKAGVMFWRDYMVFKLPEAELNEALALDGVQMFTPMDNRAMNGWAQVPYDYADRWKDWAEQSMAYTATIEVKPKKKSK